MSHTWKHFLGVVPWVRFLQGRKVRDRWLCEGWNQCDFFSQHPSVGLLFCLSMQHTWFCGAYTLFNTHELAIISGLAVAERLGAPYPFDDNELARKQFNNLLQVHAAAR